MSYQVTSYQCPNCLAPLRYDTNGDRLVCDNCGNSFEITIIQQLFADKEQQANSADVLPEWDISMTGGFSPDEAAHLRSYTCPSCAAEIICDDTSGASSCHYCGNPTVIPSQFRDQLKPDYIIPFKVNKEYAIEGLNKYYRKKRLLPKDFSDSNHIEEIKGVYVPFWLYDGVAHALLRYHGTKSHSYRRGNYEITETDHYRVVREGNVVFEKIPVDGSSRISDAHMDSIEPFDYIDLRPFTTAYFPGFLADKYDEDALMCSTRANNRIIASTEHVVKDTMNEYSTLTKEYSSVNLISSDVKYALFPVWLLTSRWKDQSFLFAMNGQTGKLIGDLPVDRGRYWGWILRIAGPIAIILAILLFFI